jgi:hypothetical protein
MVSRSAWFANLTDQDTPVATLTGMIIETVHQFVHDERRRSFCFLGKRSHCFMNQEDLLVVSPAELDDINTMRGRDRNGNSPFAPYTDRDWYTFHEPMGYDTLSPTVVLTLTEGGDCIIDNITVISSLSDGSPHSRPVDAWLREKYDWDDRWVMKFSAAQYEEQQMWWQGTLQVFRLFQLPLELREAIWLQVIGSVILPDIHNSQPILGQGLSYGNARRLGKNRDPDIERPNMVIMRVSKQVRHEALVVAYRDSFKRFRMVRRSEYSHATMGPLHPISAIVGAIQSQALHATFLRSVQLEMSAACYFSSIGIWPTSQLPFCPRRSPFHLDSLQGFTALQRLDFCFISPKHPEAICPWAAVDAANPSSPDQHSCQKIWIDWFFTFAWRDLKALAPPGQIHFSLSGCAKSSSKMRWEALLNDASSDHTPMLTAAAERIRLEKTTFGCIPCVCSTPCSRADAVESKTYAWDESDIRGIEGLQEHIDNDYWSFGD